MIRQTVIYFKTSERIIDRTKGKIKSLIRYYDNYYHAGGWTDFVARWPNESVWMVPQYNNWEC